MTSPLRSFAALLFLTLLALAAANWRSLPDPFLRHDDFPALLGFEDVVSMTLNEGRWLNYWWVARDFFWSHQTHFVLYFLGWATFSAAFAASSLAPGTAFVWRATLAVLMALAPLHFNIAQWFNTLVPGVWVLALYALVVLFTRWQVATALLLVFSPLGFSAYTTYPFLMFGMLAARWDLPQDRRTYLTVTAAFVAAFALSVLAAYTLNYLHYGIFGIPPAPWRHPNPLINLADIGENLARLKALVYPVILGLGMGYPQVGLLTFWIGILSLYALFRSDHARSGFVVTPVIMGLGLLAANVVLTGVVFPVRAAIFLWLAMIFAMVRLAKRVSSGTGRLVIAVLLLWSLILFYGYQIDRNIRLFYTGWQTVTRELAQQVPPDSTAIRIYGDYNALPEAQLARIQSLWGLRMRLEYLTGVPAIDCTETPRACLDRTPPFGPGQSPEKADVQLSGGIAFVRLPETEE